MAPGAGSDGGGAATTNDSRGALVIRSTASPGRHPPCTMGRAVAEGALKYGCHTSPGKGRGPSGPFQPASLPLRCDCCPRPWQRPFFSAQFSREEPFASKASRHSLPCGIAASLQVRGPGVLREGPSGPHFGLARITSPATTCHFPGIPPLSRPCREIARALPGPVRSPMAPAACHSKTTSPGHG